MIPSLFPVYFQTPLNDIALLGVANSIKPKKPQTSCGGVGGCGPPPCLSLVREARGQTDVDVDMDVDVDVDVDKGRPLSI